MINRFFIEGTEFTPEIIFDIDSRKFSLIGVSRPEDVIKFYQPAMNWLKELDQEITNHSNIKYIIPSIHIDFQLSYFNSASSKMLLQLLQYIKKIQAKGIEIIVEWYYDQSDEQMYEDGMDLSDSVDIPFNFHTI